MKAKKLLSIILSVLMLNFILPVVGESPVADGTTALASDQIYTYGSYEFKIASNGIEITKFNNDQPLFTLDMLDSIPVNGKKISIYSLGTESFKQDRYLTNLTVAKDVKIISKRAFYDCKNLKNVTFPNNLTQIGSEAFYGCIRLETIEIPKSVKIITDKVFYNCSNLTNVILPSNLSRIESEAFYGCQNLKSIEIPESVTYIAPNAFESSGLSEIKCYYGSYAYNYAKEHGYKDVIIGSLYTTTTTSTTTTTTTGIDVVLMPFRYESWYRKG